MNWSVCCWRLAVQWILPKARSGVGSREYSKVLILCFLSLLLSPYVIYVGCVACIGTGVGVWYKGRCHRYYILSWDRCITPEWRWWTVHLHRSAGGRLLSEQTWFSHLLLWRTFSSAIRKPSNRHVDLTPKGLMNGGGVCQACLATWPKSLLLFLTTKSLVD